MSVSKQQLVGRAAEVVSGPHEGRAGTILSFRDLSLGGADPETYAIVEFTAKNCFDEIYTDQISVPIRRLSLR